MSDIVHESRQGLVSLHVQFRSFVIADRSLDLEHDS